MRPVFPPVIEIERAQRCWHHTHNKRTERLKSRKHRSLFDVGGVGLFCRLVERPEEKIREQRRRKERGVGDRGRERMCERQRKGIRGGLQTKHLHIREKPAEPPVHNKPPIIQYQEKAHPKEQKPESYTLHS